MSFYSKIIIFAQINQIPTHLGMKNLILSACLLVGAVLSLSAQDRWLKRYENFNSKYPQERVWMHFDNHAYFQGDTIWYACYVMSDNMQRHALAKQPLDLPLSRVLYVELRSPEGLYLWRNVHYVQDNGTCQGYIHMPDSLFAGFYEVRAYTAWMLNFRDDLARDKEDDSNPWKWWWKSEVPVRDNTDYTYTDSERLLGDQTTNHYNGELVEKNDGYGFRYYVKPFIPRNGEEPGVLQQNNTYDAKGMTNQDIQHSFLYAHNPRVFSRVLPVYTRISGRPELRTMKQRQKMHTGVGFYYNDHPSVDFYPEGGHWVRNTRSHLAFEMRDGRGQHISPSNILIKHKDGTSTAPENRLHRGRNLFTTDLEFWRHYTKDSKLSFDLRGQSYTFDLPIPDEKGVALCCEWQGDSLIPQVTASGIDPAALRTVIVSHGTEGRKVGVNEVIVYDTLANLLASRLFFVYPKSNEWQKAKVEMKKGKGAIEKVSINSVPNAHISVAVIDADDKGLNYGAGNILTGMLLSSEVKGFIEDPDYYFADQSQARRDQLDLLLLVQGWRRYEWNCMTQRLGTHFYPYYKNEQKLEVSGEILSLTNKQLKKPLFLNTQITYNNKYIVDAVGDIGIDGRFSFPLLPVTGDILMTLRAYKDSADMEKKKLHYTIGKGFRYRIWKQRAISPTPKVYDFYESTDKDVSAFDDTLAVYRLDEVSVKDNGSHKLDLSQPLVRYNMIDYLDFLNDVSYRYIGNADSVDYEDNFTCQFIPYWTRLNFMRTNGIRASFNRKIRGDIKLDNATGDTVPRHQGFYVENPTRLFVDSVEWDELWKERLFYDPDHPLNNNSLRYGEISFYSDLLDRSRFLSDGKRHDIDELHINLCSKNRLSISDLTLKYEVIRIHSFQKPAQFYNEQNAGSAHAMDPFRRTLYWNPSLQTDANGHAMFDYVPKSPNQKVVITINGIAPDGTLIHFEQ